MRFSILSGFLLLSALFVQPAGAAIVSVVNDGSDGKPALVAFHAAIGKGDFAAFQRAVAKIDREATDRINGISHITVELDSPGGDVVEAVKVGRFIYQHFMMTVVRPHQECVSACVFILIAGAVHTPAADAAIGVHRPMLVSWSHMTGSQAHAKYDELMAYLRTYFIQLGVSPAAYETMMRTSAYDMRYFNAEEMDRLGLRGEDPAWEKLYGVKWADPGAAAARPYRAELPKIADIDESFRGLVVMPGAHLGEVQYFLDTKIQPMNFAWQILDDESPAWPQAIGWPEIRQMLTNIWSVLDAHFQEMWVLLALIAFEIFRNRAPERADFREQWRRSF